MTGGGTPPEAGALPASLWSLRGLLGRLPGPLDPGRRGLLALTAILGVLAVLLPLYAGSGTVLLVQQALYLGLLALSLNFLVSTAGLVSFGHAMFFGLGAYAVAIPADRYDWPVLATLSLVPFVGAAAALVIGLVVLRGKELYFALLTLGVGQLIWAVAHGWQSVTGGTNGTTGVFPPEFLSPFLHPDRLYWFVLSVVAVSTGVLYVVTRSPFGDALRGIRDNRRRAEFVGLPVRRYELAAFVVAGVFGSIAGGLTVVGETQITSSQIDWSRSALALVVCLIGGTRYFLGPLVGAVFYLVVFDYVLSKTVLWDTVLGIVILVVALGFSGGLAGAAERMLATAPGLARRAAGRGTGPAAPVLAAIEPEAVHLPAPAEHAVVAAPAPAPPGDVVLSVRGVRKAFGGLVALDGVDLDVRRGTMHAIIGPNGAGKTTFFNAVTGLLPPDSGTVVLEGEDVTGRAGWRLVKRGLARSFQQATLFWALSAEENVTLASAAARAETARPYGRHTAETRANASSLLDRVGLGAFAAVPAIELSHGDQRSLEFATTLAAEASLLLLDEPTAGLSPVETRLAVRLIREIARERGLTVLFVEHDMEVVFGNADRITVLHGGKVLADGTPDEIRANPDVRLAYLGGDDEETSA